MHEFKLLSDGEARKSVGMLSEAMKLGKLRLAVDEKAFSDNFNSKEIRKYVLVQAHSVLP